MFKRKESIEERIKRLKIENKLTLEDVANKSLLVPDIINKYENNEKEVDYIYANILAKLAKTSVSYILYGTKRKTKNDKNSILEYIAKKYLSEEEFSKLKFHNSSIDAKATMLVLKSLLLKLNISLFGLINRVGVSCIISSKYDVMQERILRKRKHLIDEIKGISKFIVKI